MANTSGQQEQATQFLREAERALKRRDAAAALGSLRQAEALAPHDFSVHMFKSMAYRTTGDLAAAQRACEKALTIDPYNFFARLSRGWLLDQQGQKQQAAMMYEQALAIAPSGPLPPDLVAPVERAREVVEEKNAALEAHLLERIADIRARHPEASLERFDESLKILAGRTKAYVQQPLLLHYPRLPAIPFFPRELFPWLPDLEAATPLIRGELDALLEQSGTEQFAPYITYPPGTPLNQWEELNRSRRWGSFFLWRDGRRQDEACARCPRTTEVLESLPMARQSGYAPTAMFSVLDANTRIPPHTGSINTRAIVHLPLLLPGVCTFRVGNVTREWRMNEAWVFDDTIEHEARNDNGELRVILIFDVWNPYLSEPERELVTAMMQARTEFIAALRR
ncbi:MAG TPA: aspartyl/asparaginyl beta-hydroxylase domain-containing protein [Woeseiaceae bacterium]|nr:aspartyl/asparaginyl beta-hydroxylase domain-containing protein [Woeseiaceae bacterium]